MTENTKPTKASRLPKFNLFLIILVGLLTIYYNSEQSRKHNFLYEVITSKHTVDFTVSEIQWIDDDFLLAGASQEKHLTGIKFTGRIINTLSSRSY